LTEFQNKTHRQEQKDSRQRFEGEGRAPAPNTNLQHYDGDNLSEGFEGYFIDSNS